MPTAIPDAALRTAIHAACGRLGESGALDDADALVSLPTLSWSEHGEAQAWPHLWAPIRHLDGVEACAALRELSLAGNHIADLGPVRGLRQLEALRLASNAVADLTPLRGLGRLRTLHLRENRIDRLDGLDALRALEALDLSLNPVADLAPLAGLPTLRTLDLSRTNVRDLSVLRTLPSLRFVALNGVNGWPASQLELAATLGAGGVRFVGPIADEVRVWRAARIPGAGPVDAALQALGEDTLVADWRLHGPASRTDSGATLLLRVAGSPAADDLRARAAAALLAAGVPVDATDEHGRTALSALLDSPVDCPALLATILGAGPNLSVPYQHPPLARVAERLGKSPHDARFDALLAAGADLAHPSVLVAFAFRGNLAGVERALAAGASPDAQWAGWGALAEAVANEHEDVVRRLLAAGADPDGRVWRVVSQLPIHAVCSHAMLGLLLGAGADPGGRTGLGETLLHLLGSKLERHRHSAELEADFIAIAREMLARGVDVNDAGASESPLTAIVAKTDAFPGLVRVLLDAGADPLVPTPVSLYQRAPDVTRMLRAAGAVAKGTDAAVAARLPDPAALAVGTPGFRSLGAMLESFAITVPNRDAYAARALDLVRAEDTPVARLLVGAYGQSRWLETTCAWLNGGRSVKGLDVIQCALPNIDLATALISQLGPHRASTRGTTTLDAVLALGARATPELVRAADTALTTIGLERDSGLTYLAGVVRRPKTRAHGLALLAAVLPRIDLCAPPHVCAVLAMDQASLVQRALAAGMDPDARVGDADSALLYAVDHGSLAAARVLLEAGASPRGAGAAGALFAARSAAAVRLLVEFGADPNQAGSYDRRTPLLHALREGRAPEVCDALLDAGADPDRADRKGETFRRFLAEEDDERYAGLAARIGG